uniref:Uncharacterized protein n=1 Tax=Utricularia reniformis TaxID=192314 RepID=A0A1Y0B3W9_9LAMI|nr:hypothetical protein AEK19_MT1916 [Utricularia reniformis]ART32083.1 hypothetical protein AEK19_MT1916 [Utricularia reniformis]
MLIESTFHRSLLQPWNKNGVNHSGFHSFGSSIIACFDSGYAG